MTPQTRDDQHAPPQPSLQPPGYVVQRITVLFERDGSTWEAIIPEFSIVGRGASRGDAGSEAIELLDDYIALCFADGMTLEESLRPMSRRLVWGFWARYVRHAALRALLHGRARVREDFWRGPINTLRACS